MCMPATSNPSVATWSNMRSRVAAACARAHHFEVIENEESHVLHGAAFLPPPRHSVPLARRRDANAAAVEQLEIRSELAGELDNGFPEALAEARVPLVTALAALLGVR